LIIEAIRKPFFYNPQLFDFRNAGGIRKDNLATVYGKNLFLFRD